MGELPDTKNQFSRPLERPFIESSLSREEYDVILTSVLCCKAQRLAGQQGHRGGKCARRHPCVCVYLTHVSLCLVPLLLSSNHPQTLFWASLSLSFPSFLIAVRWCHLDVKIRTPCDAPAGPSAGRPEGCVCKSQRGWTHSGVSTFI